MEKYLKVKN